MEARWLNPFVEATAAVLAALGVPGVGFGQLAVEEGTMTSREVTVLLGVGGGLAGAVLIGMDGATAVQLAGMMIGDGVSRPLEDELVVSAVSELGNMLVGRSSVLLEAQKMVCTITPPAVILGEHVAISVRAFRRVVLPVSTAFGPLGLSMSLHVADEPDEGHAVIAQGGESRHG